MLALVSQVRKFFEGLGWFSGEAVNDFIYGENNQMYTIIFNDDEEETWSSHNVIVNSEVASIAINSIGSQFI